MDKLKSVAKFRLTREPSRHMLFVICSSNLVENDRMDLLKMGPSGCTAAGLVDVR